MKLADCRLGIVGLGLMGGSLAEAMRGHCGRVIGVDREPAVVAAARQGPVDEASQDLGAIIAETDLLVLAVPVRASLELIGAMGDQLPAPARLLDLGSTKRQVLRAMEQLPAATDPVGGHPMCGREVSGFEFRDGRLYRGCQFVLTPLARTTQATLELVGELIEAVGAHELRMSAEDHDRLVAASSHLPYLVSAALVERAREVGRQDPRLERLLASGFRDTTRLAGSDPAMMVDILLTNRNRILQEIEGLQLSLDALKDHLTSGEVGDLLAQLSAIKEQKDRWRGAMTASEGPDDA